MDADVRLFWSASATGQFLELDLADQKRISDCVGLILQFPLIGTRLFVASPEHRRRFICGGYRITYSLEESLFEDRQDRQATEPKSHEPQMQVKITIRRFNQS